MHWPQIGTGAPLLWRPDHGENVVAESVYYMPPLQAPLGTADHCCRLQLLLPTVACFMRATSFHLIGSVLNIINCSKSQLFSINQSRHVNELPILHPPGCLDWCLTAQSAHPHHSTGVRVGDDSCPRTLYFVEDNSLCGSM